MSTSTALIGGGTGGAITLLVALLGRKHQRASTDSIVVASSNSWVVTMRAELDRMQARVDRLEQRLVDETTSRLMATAVRDAHILLLESAIRDLHGTIPPRSY